MANNNMMGKKVAIGVAAGVVAAAAAGTYFLYGSKNAKKYRGKLKSWMFSAKGEILNAIEKLQNVTEDDYQRIVDAVASKYKTVSTVDSADLIKFATDMKKHWKTISKSVSKKSRAKSRRK